MPLDPEAQAEFEEVFRADAAARMARLVELLDGLAHAPDGERMSAALEAHSIRGAAAMTRHVDIAELCHSIETVLEADEIDPSELSRLATRVRQIRLALRPA